MATLRLSHFFRFRRRRDISELPEPPYRDRDKAELLNSLKTSMEQVLAGDYRPALEVLDEIDREAAVDAHNR